MVNLTAQRAVSASAGGQRRCSQNRIALPSWIVTMMLVLVGRPRLEPK